MTPGQIRWLEKLRDTGRRRHPRYGALPCCVCYRNGWTEGLWIDSRSGAVISMETVIDRQFVGVHNEVQITGPGRMALAQSERRA